STVGTFSATDPDAGATFTYSLVAGAGSTDNAAFTIVGNQLTINASPNFEAKPFYLIRVRTTDQGGLSYDQIFAINVTDVNEAPAGTDGTVATPQNTTYTFSAADFGFTDPDAGDTMNAVRIDALPGAGSLTLTGFGAVTAGQ